MHDQIDQAIKQALLGNWKEAISLNLSILVELPNDIQALNRLARAYSELGEKDLAEQTYRQVLKLDKYNAIANKNLRLLPHTKAYNQKLANEDFIETPGETRTTSLIKVANRETLAKLCTKQEGYLQSKGRLISVSVDKKTTIGCLPDDLSFKIQRLLAKGYSYKCCIKAISENSVTIFLREVKRPNRPGYTATFSKSLTYSKLKK